MRFNLNNKLFDSRNKETKIFKEKINEYETVIDSLLEFILLLNSNFNEYSKSCISLS